jgi:hypothetical protein
MVEQNAHHKSVYGKSTSYLEFCLSEKVFCAEEAGATFKKFMCCTTGACKPMRREEISDTLHGRRQTSTKISRL